MSVSSLIARPFEDHVTLRRPTPRSPGRPVIAAIVLVAQLFLASAVNAVGPPIQAAVVDQATETTALLPGIHYEDALAHADDRTDFTPGGRVTVGFRPRGDDTWEVGGRAPRALPAGSASGREMRPAQSDAASGAPGAAASPAAEPGRPPARAPAPIRMPSSNLARPRPLRSTRPPSIRPRSRPLMGRLR